MAITEVTGVMKYKDADGNTFIMLPATTKENVEGLEDFDAHLLDKENPHEVSYDQLVEKPFYEETVETVLIEETSNEWTDLSFNGALLLEPVELKVDQIYKVYWDGQMYECTSHIAEASNTIGIGNDIIAEIGSISNGEPFFFTVFDGQTIIFSETLGSHTIKVISSIKEVHQIDEKYLPENIQSDWNQNDETALDYVKNRPFYTDPISIDYTLEEQTLEFTDLSNSNPYNKGGSGYGHILSDYVYADHNICTDFDVLKEGTLEYLVAWDGVEYTCVASEGDGIEMFSLGNLSLYRSNKADTGEPFLILANVFYDTQGLYVFSNDASSATHTVSIGVKTGGEIHQIDAKYIPALSVDDIPTLTIDKLPVDPIPIEKGGTGATTIGEARGLLGVGVGIGSNIDEDGNSVNRLYVTTEYPVNDSIGSMIFITVYSSFTIKGDLVSKNLIVNGVSFGILSNIAGDTASPSIDFVPGLYLLSNMFTVGTNSGSNIGKDWDWGVIPLYTRTDLNINSTELNTALEEVLA